MTEPEAVAEKECSASFSDDLLGSVPVLAPVPVLAAPVDRGGERVLARFGLIESAPLSVAANPGNASNTPPAAPADTR